VNGYLMVDEATTGGALSARRTSAAVVSEFLSGLPDAPTETRNLVGAQLLRALGLTKAPAVLDDEVDDVPTVAQTEAMAGVRRVNALSHSRNCPCDVCGVRRRKDRA
jgi:hypothetical protein